MSSVPCSTSPAASEASFGPSQVLVTLAALPAFLDLMLKGSEGNPLFCLQASKFSLYGAWEMSLLSLLVSAVYAAAPFLLNARALRPSLVMYGIKTV